MVDEQRELQEIHKTALREAEAIKNALEVVLIRKRLGRTLEN